MNSISALYFCAVIDYGTKCHARSFCQKHYRRFAKRGELPEIKPQVRNCIVEHYQNWRSTGSPIAKQAHNPKGDCYAWIMRQMESRSRDECWADWPAKPSSDAGRLYLRRDGLLRPAAHTVMELDGRPRPYAPNNHALHSCDNPPCINPAHLRWGTSEENIADMVLRDRCGTLTHQQVTFIRQNYTGMRGEKVRLARELGVSKTTIGNAINGKTWKNIE
jgi:hypothetical protein